MAQDVNVVLIGGRLTRDPELRNTSGGTSLAKFCLASNRRTKRGEQWIDEASFVDVTSWGSQAEACGRYLSKGSAVLVEGELRQERWTDRDTGQQRSKLAVNASRVHFLGEGGRQSRHGSGSDARRGATVGRGRTPASDEDLDSDLPF